MLALSRLYHLVWVLKFEPQPQRAAADFRPARDRPGVAILHHFGSLFVNSRGEIVRDGYVNSGHIHTGHRVQCIGHLVGICIMPCGTGPAVQLYARTVY